MPLSAITVSLQKYGKGGVKLDPHPETGEYPRRFEPIGGKTPEGIITNDSRVVEDFEVGESYLIKWDKTGEFYQHDDGRLLPQYTFNLVKKLDAMEIVEIEVKLGEGTIINRSSVEEEPKVDPNHVPKKEKQTV